MVASRQKIVGRTVLAYYFFLKVKLQHSLSIIARLLSIYLSFGYPFSLLTFT